MFGIDCLITFSVLWFYLPFNKLWKRCFSQIKKCLFKLIVVPIIKKSQGSSARGGIINYLSNQDIIFTKI